MKYILTLAFSCLCWFVMTQNQTVSKAYLDSIAEAENARNNLTKRNFDIIENVPIYKGCENEKGNVNKKKCMSEKISQLFAENYNRVIPEDEDIEPGTVRVFVTFKIDEVGHVIQAEAKGPAKFLEEEAKRVTKLIPQLTPGKQRGKPVIVPYSLPLNIRLEARANSNSRYPIYRGCDESLSNEDLENCTKKKIVDFIKVSFDYQMADRVFLTEESTTFQLDFIISKKGKVKDINAKANHKAVAIEVIRLAQRLPKFKSPGTKNGRPVDVPFSLLMTVYFP